MENENIDEHTSCKPHDWAAWFYVLCFILFIFGLFFMAFQYDKAVKDSSRQLTNVEIADLLKTEDDCVVGKLRDEAESYVLVVRDLDDSRVACQEQAYKVKRAKEYEQKRKQQQEILLSGPEH